MIQTFFIAKPCQSPVHNSTLYTPRNTEIDCQSIGIWSLFFVDLQYYSFYIYILLNTYAGDIGYYLYPVIILILSVLQPQVSKYKTLKPSFVLRLPSPSHQTTNHHVPEWYLLQIGTTKT